jgi:hypothetical protein
MDPPSKHARSNPTTPDSCTSTKVYNMSASLVLCPFSSSNYFIPPPLSPLSIIQCGSPNGVEQNCIGTPKTGRWTKREDELLKEAVDEFGIEVRADTLVFFLLFYPLSFVFFVVF